MGQTNTVDEPAQPGPDASVVAPWDDTPGADLAESRRREQWLRSLLTNVTDAISVIDAAGNVLFATGQVADSLGYPGDEWRGRAVFDLVHPDDLPSVHESLARTLALAGQPNTVEVRVLAADGSWADLEATGVNRLDDPDVRGVVITTRNITPVRRAERLASSQAAVLELIARAAPLDDVFERCVCLVEENGMGGRSSIYMRDGDHLTMRAGRAPHGLNEYLDRQPASGPGEAPRSVCDVSFATGEATIVPDLAACPDVHPVLRALAPALRIESAWSQPILATATGEVIGTLSTIYEAPHTPGRHERTVGEMACSLVAIAMERVEAEARLAHQALHDALTGLPNRALLLDRLDHALARRGEASPELAVLFCDLDRFKVVNDSLGHAVGDQLLVAVAERLTATVGTGNTVARFGGDEFVVLLDDPDERHDPVAVAERIATALDGAFTLPSGQEVNLTVSIGLAHARGHATGDTWLRDADAAMYRAKENGRNRLAVFDTGMRHAAVLRLQVESDLRHAVERDELVVHYQPVVDLVGGTVCGAEALVRWEHPERGLLGPDQFIPVAEETGAISALGAWVLDRAVADMASLLPIIDGRFQLGVNLSARQLDDRQLDADVAAACERHGWSLDDLLLEVTESSLTVGTTGPCDLLARLRALGLEMAIDDFGTGHSSLARLGAMPFSQVKIDRSFVASEDGRMVSAVVAVAGALDLRTCAEGIETPAQLERVRAAGCDLAQGYLFSRPLPLAAFTALLGTRPAW